LRVSARFSANTVPTIFAVGAVLCLILGFGGLFPGLQLWGVVLIVVAILALIIEAAGGRRSEI
jgi:hypothetical protein